MSEGVNAINVLGRDLLLVDVGGGAETHLAREAEDDAGRAAIERDRFDDGSWIEVPTVLLYDDDSLKDARWEPTTLCGRGWYGMAAGESGPLRRWHDTSLAPTCRSCLRVLDGWFPESKAPSGIELLAVIIADRVEEFGSTTVTSVPAEHLEATRRAARKHLHAKGFRSTTHVVNDVLHVLSDERALRLIAASFFLFAAYVGGQALFDLVTRSKPEESSPGSSSPRPPWSSCRRWRTRSGDSGGAWAAARSSPAAARRCCARTCPRCCSSGLLANGLFGWWWADPITALLIAALAVREGREAWRGDVRCDAC
ncbi:MAG: hypothetical protein HYX32_10135 [Actinobacteria bacterium]|nr:hypothetical protein [Actinomycetota bacterium]